MEDRQERPSAIALAVAALMDSGACGARAATGQFRTMETLALDRSDLRILRDLALRVKEIASLPVQQERIKLWKAHNSLRGERPMLLVFPEGAWRELMPEGTLKCEAAGARTIEWSLRERLYYHDHLDDDTVIHANFDVPKSIHNSGWGMHSKRIESTESRGSWKFDPVIFEPADMKKLSYPTITFDDAETVQRFEPIRAALGDILNVRLRGVSHISFHLMAEWTRFRGLEQTMIDMADDPPFVHDAMQLLADGAHGVVKQYVEQNLLDVNNDYTYHSSGGNGWTDELPAAGFDPKRVRPCDMWASAESQELAEVSPAMHADFALRYEKELLAPFALNGYGCCEALHNKMNDVLAIPNIRRISMSPWADLALSAQKLGRKAIFSWKPMPSMLVGSYAEEHIRKYIREALERTRGCVFEMVLKDTHTIESRPERMHRWLKIAREEMSLFGAG